MKTVINALKAQFLSEIDYCSDSGYVCKNPFELVQLDKFPFFNITPGDRIRVLQIEDMYREQGQRWVYPLKIHLAEQAIGVADDSGETISMLGNDNIKGLLPFINDIVAAIMSDRTLGGVVTDFEIDTDIEIDILETAEMNNISLAGAELSISFYKDVLTP